MAYFDSVGFRGSSWLPWWLFLVVLLPTFGWGGTTPAVRNTAGLVAEYSNSYVAVAEGGAEEGSKTMYGSVLVAARRWKHEAMCISGEYVGVNVCGCVCCVF